MVLPVGTMAISLKNAVTFDRKPRPVLQRRYEQGTAHDQCSTEQPAFYPIDADDESPKIKSATFNIVALKRTTIIAFR